LKDEFEIKDLEKTKFYLGLQIEHISIRKFIHQSTYTEKILKHFNMDNVHPLSTSMVVRSLDVNKDFLWLLEEILGQEVPYFSVIGALMYFANYTRPDIAFVVNLLAKYSSTPIKKNVGMWSNIYFAISAKQLK
jgi:hypothetical protein